MHVTVFFFSASQGFTLLILFLFLKYIHFFFLSIYIWKMEWRHRVENLSDNCNTFWMTCTFEYIIISHLLQLPLYKIKHFGLTSGIFFFFWNMIVGTASKPKSKLFSETSVECGMLLQSSVAVLNQRHCALPLFCIHVLAVAYRLLYAVPWLHWAGTRGKLVYSEYHAQSHDFLMYAYRGGKMWNIALRSSSAIPCTVRQNIKTNP